MSTTTPLSTIPASFANGVELLWSLFFQICNSSLDRAITIMTDGAIVFFHTGPYEKRAVRIGRTGDSLAITFHYNHFDTKAPEPTDRSIFLTLTLSLRDLPNGSFVEKLRGRAYVQNFFISAPGQGLGHLRQGECGIGGLEFVTLFTQLIQRSPTDGVWSSEVLASWGAGITQVATLPGAVPVAAIA